MANRNSVSLEDKLLIWLQYKISPLQFFFAMFLCWTATPVADLFIYVFVFSLCLDVFLFILLEGWGCFSPIFHLSHLVEFNALIFSLWYGERHFWKNCQVQIKNGWGGCNIELVNTSRDLSTGYGTRFPFSPLLLLPLSAPGVSLCSQNNAWVMSALGRRCSVQRFSTNAPHNDHVLLPLCTSSIDYTL